MSFRFEFVEV